MLRPGDIPWLAKIRAFLRTDATRSVGFGQLREPLLPSFIRSSLVSKKDTTQFQQQLSPTEGIRGSVRRPQSRLLLLDARLPIDGGAARIYRGIDWKTRR
jgi:hypothetical protein